MQPVSTFRFILLLSFAFVFSQCTSHSDKILINNITSIDADIGLLANQCVIINQNIIEKVKVCQNENPARFAKVIDGTGKFLIPGLWDAHIHMVYDTLLTNAMFDLFLSYGITSIRDTGGQMDQLMPWVNKSNENPRTTPRLKIAGPLLDGVPTVYDGSVPQRPKLAVSIPDSNTLRMQMESLYEQGVDHFKAYEMLTKEQLKKLIEIGDYYGYNITGHVPLSMDAIDAANMGMNSMEHMRNLELSCSSDWEKLLAQRLELLEEGKNDPGGVLRSRIHDAQRGHAIATADEQRMDKVVDALADNRVWQIPTYSVMTNGVNLPYADADWQKSYEDLPSKVKDRWRSVIPDIMAKEINPRTIAYKKWMHVMTKKMLDKDVPIMAGTDAPIFFLTPGFSLHDELVLLVEAGMSPIQALESATLGPAKYFNLDDKLGTIDDGKIADLLIIDANPLDNIANTSKIHAVMKDGYLMDKNYLDSLRVVHR